MKKTIKTLMVLAAATMLPLQAMAIKILHGPYLQSVGETQATIVWTTDSLSTAWVELSPDDGTDFYAQARTRYYDTEIGIKRTARIHAVTLKGLKPGTTYRYRIYSQEVLSHKEYKVTYGNIAASAAYKVELPKFTTLDKNKQSTTFLVVNDIHEKNDVMTRLFNNASYKDKELVFFNGDMMSLFDKDAKLWGGFMDTAVKLFASEKPLYYVRGNHETRGQLADQFKRYVRPNDDKLYFSFRQGPVYFICLDTGEDKADTDMEYYGITDYDNYRTEQAEWLRSVIASDEYKQAPLHVVIAHIPPRYGKDAWHGDIEIREKFIPILNQANVDLMLCAHLHEFVYTEPNAQLKFPILTNSNETIVSAKADGGKLDVKVIDLNGKTTFQKTYGQQ